MNGQMTAAALSWSSKSAHTCRCSLSSSPPSCNARDGLTMSERLPSIRLDRGFKSDRRVSLAETVRSMAAYDCTLMTLGQPDLRRLVEGALPGCRPQTWTSLLETARLRQFRPNEAVFGQGELVPLNLVIRGYCAFRRTTLEGRQVTVRIVGPRELSGFTSIGSTRASGDLIALTHCEVALWSGKAIRELAAGDPAFALFAIERLATILNMVTERVDGLVHQGARRRVIRILTQHRDLF